MTTEKEYVGQGRIYHHSNIPYRMARAWLIFPDDARKHLDYDAKGERYRACPASTTKREAGANMEGLRVILQTTTPLRLCGADPRGAYEVRAASLRGVLRFWLRALLGGEIGDGANSLKALRQAEGAVFGDTKLGASRVVVRLTANSEQGTSGIPAGSLLTLTIVPRPPYHSVPDAVWGALHLFVLLGGLGKRSRRGNGSFIVHSYSGGIPIPFSDYSNADSFGRQAKDIIFRSRGLVKSYTQSLGMKSGDVNDPPSFPVFHDQHTKVLFCKEPFTSWERAIQACQDLLRSQPYRGNHVFGFARGRTRQASPLHVRVVKLGSQYHILFTAFRYKFASENNRPSWAIMQKFLKESEQEWNGEWLFGGDSTWR